MAMGMIQAHQRGIVQTVYPAAVCPPDGLSSDRAASDSLCPLGRCAMKLLGSDGAVSTLILCLLVSAAGCKRQAKPFIAAIPRTTGVALWEAMREGAAAAAASQTSIYWNAPTQQDDIDGQIVLLQAQAKRPGLQGILLAADHSRALVTTVRRILNSGIPVVVIGSPLDIPAAGRLTYVLNDENEGGRLAAERVGTILNGEGAIAILGIDPGSVGVMERAQSFEASLARLYPGVRVVERRFGTYNLQHEQQVASETLHRFPALQMIVSMNSTALRGAYFALADSRHADRVKLLGFDQDIAFDRVKDGAIDSVIVEDTYQMGNLAVQEILAEAASKEVPQVVRLKPVLVTRSNLESPDVQHMLLYNWRLLR